MDIRKARNGQDEAPVTGRYKSVAGRRSVRAGVILTLMLALAGCDLLGGGTSTAPPPRAQQASAPPPPPVMMPVSVVDEYQRPEYPSRRRNPFQPDPDVVQPARTEVAGEVRPLDPLEEFGLNQLSLVTVISETAVPLAMFIDPSGLGHFVKEGDRIGRNSGTVASIRDNEVEIREGVDEGDAMSGAVVRVRLRDGDLTVGESGLSEQEQEALRRLLQSQEGRAALEQSYREMAPGAAAADGASPPRPVQSDDRFPGLAPPRAERRN